MSSATPHFSCRTWAAYGVFPQERSSGPLRKHGDEAMRYPKIGVPAVRLATIAVAASPRSISSFLSSCTDTSWQVPVGAVRNKSLIIVAVAVSLAASGGAAYADPPPWAPAWGWRAKHHDGEPVYVVPQPVYVAPQPIYAVPPPPAVTVLPWGAQPTAAPYGIASSTCHRKALGALIGAGAGAYIGNNLSRHQQVATTIAGGVLGDIVGGLIGDRMDELDQSCAGQVLEHARTGQAVAWRDPNSDARYTVTPVKTWQAEDGRYCREYTAKATINGHRQDVFGTACRQPDGAWQLVN